MKILVAIQESLKRQGIKFKVLIPPDKTQLMGKRPGYMVPQKMLSEYFRKYDIDHVDTIRFFKQENTNAAKYFLYGDPLHLSDKGHSLVFDIAKGDIVPK